MVAVTYYIFSYSREHFVVALCPPMGWSGISQVSQKNICP